MSFLPVLNAVRMSSGHVDCQVMVFFFIRRKHTLISSKNLFHETNIYPLSLESWEYSVEVPRHMFLVQVFSRHHAWTSE